MFVAPERPERSIVALDVLPSCGVAVAAEDDGTVSSFCVTGDTSWHGATRSLVPVPAAIYAWGERAVLLLPDCVRITDIHLVDRLVVPTEAPAKSFAVIGKMVLLGLASGDILAISCNGSGVLRSSQIRRLKSSAVAIVPWCDGEGVVAFGAAGDTLMFNPTAADAAQDAHGRVLGMSGSAITSAWCCGSGVALVGTTANGVAVHRMKRSMTTPTMLESTPLSEPNCVGSGAIATTYSAWHNGALSAHALTSAGVQWCAVLTENASGRFLESQVVVSEEHAPPASATVAARCQSYADYLAVLEPAGNGARLTLARTTQAVGRSASPVVSLSSFASPGDTPTIDVLMSMASDDDDPVVLQLRRLTATTTRQFRRIAAVCRDGTPLPSAPAAHTGCAVTVATSSDDLEEQRSSMDVFVLAKLVGDIKPRQCFLRIPSDCRPGIVLERAQCAFDRRLSLAFAGKNGKLVELKRTTAALFEVIDDDDKELLCRPLYPGVPRFLGSASTPSMANSSLNKSDLLASLVASSPAPLSRVLSPTAADEVVSRLTEQSHRSRSRLAERLDETHYPVAKLDRPDSAVQRDLTTRLTVDPWKYRNRRVDRVRNDYYRKGVACRAPDLLQDWEDEEAHLKRFYDGGRKHQTDKIAAMERKHLFKSPHVWPQLRTTAAHKEWQEHMKRDIKQEFRLRDQFY
jgi:hypothetical protein